MGKTSTLNKIENDLEKELVIRPQICEQMPISEFVTLLVDIIETQYNSKITIKGFLRNKITNTPKNIITSTSLDSIDLSGLKFKVTIKKN